MIDRIGELLTRLRSANSYQLQEAVKELGRYGDDGAVAGLVMALEDSNLSVRELAADILVQRKGETVYRLLICFLADDNIVTRNLAAEVLVRIGLPAVQPLIEALNTNDNDVCKFIIDVLGLIEDERAVEPLCGKLKDKNFNIVCAAVEALGEIGSKEAIPALVAAYDKIEDVRFQVVEALAKINNPSTLEALYGFLNSSDPQILCAVIQAIGSIDDINSVDRLLKYLDHKDQTVAEAAMAAIININHLNPGKINRNLPLDRFIDFLVAGVKNRDKKTTEFTLHQLSSWHGERVVRSLLEILDAVEENEFSQISEILAQVAPSVSDLVLEKLACSPPAMKVILLDFLKPFLNDEIVQKLLSFVDDPNHHVRREIGYTLGIAGYTSAIPALKKLAIDEVRCVRAAAFAALGWVGSEMEFDFLFSGLEDKYADVREAAIGALIIIGGPKVVAKFTADLYHPNAERQRLSVTALGLIGETDVVRPLLRAINHPWASIRKSAIHSLTRISGVTDIQPLRVALNDENSEVRKAAASALIAIQGEKAVPDITFLLDDKDDWVRYHIINSIGSLGVGKYSEYILPYLDDRQGIIRVAAITALTRMGYRHASPALKKLRNEENTSDDKAAKKTISGLKGIGQ